MNFDAFKFKNVPAIYRIRNTKTRKIYIGSSITLHKRISRHAWELDKNVHSNSHLQRSYNLYGKYSFFIDVLEYCEPNVDIISREQFWMDILNPEYNMIPIAGKTAKGKKLSEEQKAHLSKINMGHIVSNETKLKISNSKKGVKRTSKPKIKESIWKTTYSEERKLSIALAKASLSEETIKAIRLNSSEGMTYSEIATKFQISSINVGKIVRRETYKWVI